MFSDVIKRRIIKKGATIADFIWIQRQEARVLFTYAGWSVICPVDTGVEEDLHCCNQDPLRL